jgi:hypothetical protein
MQTISGNTNKKVSKIYEYQRFVKLNEQFIHELEQEGGDTSQLRSEIAELKRKITELKIQTGFRH